MPTTSILAMTDRISVSGEMPGTATSSRVAASASGSDADDAQALLRFAEQGDRDALAAVWRLHGESCLRLGLARLGNLSRAEDAVQNAFIEAMRSAKRYAPQRGSVRTFLFSLVSHACAVERRREERLARRHREAPVPPVPDPVDAEAQWALREALDRLPASLRLVVELRYLSGCDNHEIATAMRLSEGAVRVRLHRGLERLRVLAVAVGLRGATPALCLSVLAALAASDVPSGVVDRLVAVAVRGPAAAAVGTATATWIAVLVGAALAGALCVVGFAGGGRTATAAAPPVPTIPSTVAQPANPLSAIQSAAIPIAANPAPANPSSLQPASPPVAAPPVADSAPLADDAARLAAASLAVSDFSALLFAELGTQPGNVVVSPWSMQAALTMTMAGARGDTLIEMHQALRHAASASDALAGIGLIDRALAPQPDRRTGKPAYQLSSANRLWPAIGYPMRPEYLDLLRVHLRSDVEALNFAAAPEPARQRINGWVAERTNQLIPELIPSGNITGTTRLVLTNALHFKGAWDFSSMQPGFNPDRSSTAAFHGRTKTTQVTMMDGSPALVALAIPHGALVVMPFAGDAVEMLLLVPEDRDPAAAKGTSALGAQLGSATVAAWRKAAVLHDVDLRLPRFAARQATSMSPLLQTLGMRQAFDHRTADFTGMHSAKEPFWIAEVIHEAVIKVDEHGAEAAATAVVAKPGGLPPKLPMLSVTADKPFFFILRHISTGAWLMVGRVEEL